MSETTQKLTEEANASFGLLTNLLGEGASVVAVILSCPSEEGNGISIGISLTNALGARDRALLFKAISEQCAVEAVEADVAQLAQETAEAPKHKLCELCGSPIMSIPGSGVEGCQNPFCEAFTNPTDEEYMASRPVPLETAPC